MTEPREFITVIAGLPRSGTSLAMRMLDAGGIPALTDGERTADESNPNGYFELEAAKKTKVNPGWVSQAQGKAVKVISLLIPDLPTTQRYRVLFMRRNLREVVVSQSVMLGRMGKKGGGLDPAQLIGLDEKQVRAAEAYLASTPAFTSLDVWYSELIANPGPQLKQINDFLGGGLNIEAMAAAIDPTLYRQRAGNAVGGTSAVQRMT